MIAYIVELTPDEWTTLRWLEARGYSADMIKHATETDADDERVILRYRESDAWAVLDAYHDDEHAFTACAGRELAAKMRAFVDEIV